MKKSKWLEYFKDYFDASPSFNILYFDSGSAVNGVHEYIIKRLAKEFSGIERIVIRSL